MNLFSTGLRYCAMGNEYLHISLVIHSAGFLMLLLLALLWPLKKGLSGQSSLLFYFFIIVNLIKGIEQFFAFPGLLTEQGFVFFLLQPLLGFLLINYLTRKISVRLQSRLNYLLIAAISVALTLYATGNTQSAGAFITYFNTLLTTVLSIAALMALVKQSNLLFFKEDLFWVSLGAAFYSLMYLLFSLLLLTGWYEKGGEAEFSLLMDLFNVVQIGCFLSSVLVSRHREYPLS